MSSTIIVVILVLLMFVIGVAVVLLMLGGDKAAGSLKRHAAVSSNLRSLVAAQRAREDSWSDADARAKANLALAAAAESDLDRRETTRTSRVNLKKKLKFACWSITPTQFRTIQAIATLLVYVPLYLHATIYLQGLVILVPFLVEGVLDRSVSKRFQAFDADYPVLLMSYVSLLKTGMSTIGGLESAAKGLDEGSLVRSEVELLVERLRLGMTEEQAINSFGEDVSHPELELFVQSLLLSRKVGGTLSTTLERLAKQVRKRQQFRQQAHGAVAMERSSIYVIAMIMTALLMYLTYSSPELVLPALNHPFGSKIFQGGLFLIVIGFYWSKKVTNIKI